PPAAFRIDTAKLQWHSDAERIVVDSLQLDAFAGHLRGNAEWPLQSTIPATGKLELDGVDLAPLSQAIVDIAQKPGTTKPAWLTALATSGRVSGPATAVLAPQVCDHPRQLSGDVHFESDKLVADDIAVQRVTADLNMRDGVLTYHAAGRM